MSDRVYLVHEGQAYQPFEPGREWAHAWGDLEPEEADNRRQIIAGGTLYTPEGDPFDPKVSKRVKARLAGKYASTPAAGALSGEEGRWLVPDVWRWGHMPMLSGQPRAGKSTLLADLIAALLIPGRQFLDAYGAVDLTKEERNRGVWLINGENPEPEQQAVIEATGLEYWLDDDGFGNGGGRFLPKGDAPGWLLVDHLSRLGGPSSFDLRIPAIYDMWLNRIMDLTCAVCDGRDESPPLAFIVDGLTAILGSDTTAYGEWYAKFRELMYELGIPNALVVVHSPMNGGEAMNGVESIAGADGTWKYQMSNVHDPRSTRTFSGSRRLVPGGIEGGTVTLENGRPRLKGGGKLTPTAAHSPEEPEEVRPPDYWASDVLDRLHRAGSEGLMTVQVTDSGKEGTHRRAALKALVDAGRVTSEPEGKGRRYFIVDVD